jgi:hypothetical protein
MKKTYCVPAALSNNGTFQHKVDKFWDWIEGRYQTDELWRVAANGDMILEVDEALLVKLLGDDGTKAYEDFDAYEEHSPEAAAWEWHDLPYDLLGTYIIKGVYDASQRLVDGERSYFFVQGA